MTDDRTLERAARSWLDEGPTRAPERPVEAALARITKTRQERGFQVPWRMTIMNRANWLAAAALVAILAIGLAALVARPAPNIGPSVPTATPAVVSTPSPAPTEVTLAAYQAARNALCEATATASPVPEPSDWNTDPSAAAEFLRQVIARGNALVAALADLDAPPAIEAEHLANVQTGRDTVAILEHERQLLLDGKVADALAVDQATGPLNRAFETFETKYSLTACA